MKIKMTVDLESTPAKKRTKRATGCQRAAGAEWRRWLAHHPHAGGAGAKCARGEREGASAALTPQARVSVRALTGALREPRLSQMPSASSAVPQMRPSMSSLNSIA